MGKAEASHALEQEEYLDSVHSSVEPQRAFLPKHQTTWMSW
jgi:hypothetical protein